ncbi:MAG: hypothetical protein WAM44_16225, partial [Chthoniobacterales bacterium]
MAEQYNKRLDSQLNIFPVAPQRTNRLGEESASAKYEGGQWSQLFSSIGPTEIRPMNELRAFAAIDESRTNKIAIPGCK